MMQLTFILGNGFDLAIKMKTSYGNFYEWYKDQPDESEEVKLLKITIQEELAKGNDNWKDFEYALGQFTAIVTDKRKFINCFECARESLITYLKKVYDDAKAANNDFLKSATYRLVELSQKISEDLPENKKQLFSVSKETKTIFNCISFNYTPVLRDGAKDMTDNAGGISNRDGWYGTYEIGKTLNVHGQLDDFPILGVDNPSQIANMNFRDDPDILELMVKGEIDKRLGKDWRAEAREIINSSDKIYVYGASMGDTDEFWWKEIAHWFEVDLDQHQLALYCHPNANLDVMKANQERFVKSISKHFTTQNYCDNIVIDSKEKTMTVKFAYASAHSTIGINAYVAAHAVSAVEYFQNKG